MTGWAGETTLDVEYAHTIAPGANIVLVETPDAETEGVTGFPNIVKAELAILNHPDKYGIKGKATVISQSFGATEETFTSFKQLAPLRAAYVEAARKGVSVLASTGDDGATNATLDGSEFYTTPVTGWPATDPLVTAIGGTQIKQDAATGKYSQVTWNDSFDVPLQQAFTGTDGPNPFSTGGGVSEFFKLPAYQAGVAKTIAAAVGENKAHALPRAVPDISMSGACDGAVTVYYTLPRWQPRLAPGLRHLRGGPAVLRHRGAGGPGRPPQPRPDQPAAVRAAGAARPRPGRRDLGQQHGRVLPGRPGAELHRPGLRRQAGL